MSVDPDKFDQIRRLKIDRTTGRMTVADVGKYAEERRIIDMERADMNHAEFVLCGAKEALDRALHNQCDAAKYQALMVAEATVAVAVATIKAGR
jgi:hypothetical protein